MNETDVIPAQNRTWRVARPIAGLPAAEDFRLEEEPMPHVGDGQILVRTIYISIAPGVRPLLPYAGVEPDVAHDAASGRSDASADRLPDPSHIRIGETMRSGIVPSDSPYSGGTVGQVVKSAHSKFQVGDYVFGGRLWQAYEVMDGRSALRLDPNLLPIEADLTFVGRSAFTGWVGYRRFCEAKAGETIVVSAAAGAVAMLVIQFAKRDGLRVIGIASGEAKCRFVRERLGADACIDRAAEDVGEALDRWAPQGVDIYFDNVGGRVQAPVFSRLKPFGRHIVCGMAAEYNGLESSVLATGAILAKRIRIQGFVVLDHEKDFGEFRSEIAKLFAGGAFVYDQYIFDGLEQAPTALAASLSGRYDGGKILVRVSADDSK